MEKDIAISVQGVSKTFKIPHEKVTSLRGAAIGMFSRRSGYEEFEALDNVSFEIKKGEFFGIIGRNGSGKSTLLKILAGIYQSDEGKIEIDGLISPFLELGIGFNPELSGRDNVYLNATVLGMTKKQIDEKFDSIVAFSELERFIDQKLKNYSSGMQVRLAFSVAIHANRDILLMDEVLAVGDSNFQSKCLTEFNRYREMGKTVILVTHDISTIQRYCDRALLLRNGKIIKIGKAEEVGDAYVYENISDEERRLTTETNAKGATSSKVEESRIKKTAEIIKVDFLDKDGKIKNVFQTGDDMLIRVYFRQNKKTEVLNFGVAIFNQENNYIFGINTIFDKVDTKKYMQQGFFEVSYKNINIGKNSYFVSAGIWKENAGLMVDFLNKSGIFKVFTKNKNDGIVHLDYIWK